MRFKCACLASQVASVVVSAHVPLSGTNSSFTNVWWRACVTDCAQDLDTSHTNIDMRRHSFKLDGCHHDTSVYAKRDTEKSTCHAKEVVSDITAKVNGGNAGECALHRRSG